MPRLGMTYREWVKESQAEWDKLQAQYQRAFDFDAQYHPPATQDENQEDENDYWREVTKR